MKLVRYFLIGALCLIINIGKSQSFLDLDYLNNGSISIGIINSNNFYLDYNTKSTFSFSFINTLQFDNIKYQYFQFDPRVRFQIVKNHLDLFGAYNVSNNYLFNQFQHWFDVDLIYSTSVFSIAGTTSYNFDENNLALQLGLLLRLNNDIDFSLKYGKRNFLSNSMKGLNLDLILREKRISAKIGVEIPSVSGKLEGRFARVLISAGYLITDKKIKKD